MVLLSGVPVESLDGSPSTTPSSIGSSSPSRRSRTQHAQATISMLTPQFLRRSRQSLRRASTLTARPRCERMRARTYAARHSLYAQRLELTSKVGLAAATARRQELVPEDTIRARRTRTPMSRTSSTTAMPSLADTGTGGSPRRRPQRARSRRSTSNDSCQSDRF